MTSPPDIEHLAQLVADAIVIMSEPGIVRDDFEKRVLALAGDPMLARRLIDVTTEAFGLVMVGHMAKCALPTTFMVRHGRQKWLEFPLKAEPIFDHAFRAALGMIHSAEQKPMFRDISFRSSMVAAVSSALDAGTTLDALNGAVFKPLRMLGIPAAVYGAPPLSWWRRLIRKQGPG